MENRHDRLCCGDCKYWNILDGTKHHCSECKRVDHQSVRFHVPFFKSYMGGDTHMICSDFVPRASNTGYTTFSEYWQRFKTQFLPYQNENITLPFILGNNTKVWYNVPLKAFLDGSMIENGTLKAVSRSYYKRRLNGSTHYKLVTEPIEGVRIDVEQQAT